MRTKMKTLGLTALFLTGLGAASLLYASERDNPDKPPMDRGGMMGMKGMGGMMGMMEMMSQMSRMMGHCNEMMQSMKNSGGSERPNEHWREKSPAMRKKDG